MLGGPVLELAQMQAWVRARIGLMPDDARWHYIADAVELDNLIERMRDNGLAYWVRELPRSPSTGAIEDHLDARLAGLLFELGRMLPARWRGLRPWLNTGARLLYLGRLRGETELDDTQLKDPWLRALSRLSLPERREQLRRSVYQDYVTSDAPLDLWIAEFSRHRPPVTEREGYMIGRLQRLLDQHRFDIEALSRAALSASPDHAAQWRLRGELAQRLRALLGGSPFHATLMLIYGLLEALQYERCRALLLSRARNWQRPELALGGAA
jgi:hypothetical protein